MELTVLVENTTLIGEYYKGEPGFCCLLRDGERQILFDTGYSGLLVENAAAMGIDLEAVDTIVLSHGHDDHAGGLPAFLGAFPRWKGRLVCHPDALAPKRIDGKEAGFPLSHEETARRFDLTASRQPVKISDHITFLGEIPRETAFESRHPLGERWDGSAWVPDFLPDDTALAVEGADGLWVVTGCSHSGVCNIVTHAARVAGKPVEGLMGGFHLTQAGPQSRETAAFLQNLSLRRFIPCHCTCFDARVEMVQAGLPVSQIGVGSRVEL